MSTKSIDLKYILPAGCSFLDLSDERFRAAIEEIILGDSRITFIAGPKGTGKTTLMKVAKQHFGDSACCLCCSRSEALRFSSGFKEIEGLSDLPTDFTAEYYWSESKGIIKDMEKRNDYEIEKPLPPEADEGLQAYLYDSDVLLVDDVESLSADMFDFLMVQVCDVSRQKGSPVRMICFGDPLGLSCREGDFTNPIRKKPFYDSCFWNECGVNAIVLKKVYGRPVKDPALWKARKELRTHITGAPLTEETSEFIRKLYDQDIQGCTVWLYSDWDKCREVLKKTRERLCKGVEPERIPTMMFRILPLETDPAQVGLRIPREELFSCIYMWEEVLVTEGKYEGLCGKVSGMNLGERFVEVNGRRIYEKKFVNNEGVTDSYLPVIPAEALTCDAVRGINVKRVGVVTEGFDRDGALYFAFSLVGSGKDIVLRGSFEDMTKPDGPLRTSVSARNLLDEYEEEISL